MSEQVVIIEGDSVPVSLNVIVSKAFVDQDVVEKIAEVKAEAAVEENVQKRGRGRPRKIVEPKPAGEEEIKRGRGRPRKYSVLVSEKGSSGVEKRVVKKVESGYLIKHMFQYFTKLLVLHGELCEANERKEGGDGAFKSVRTSAVFQRLKLLDFQMVQVCKTVLSKEFILGGEAAISDSCQVEPELS